MRRSLSRLSSTSDFDTQHLLKHLGRTTNNICAVILQALSDLRGERVEAGLSPMIYVHCAWEYKAQGVTTAAQMNFFGLAVVALDGMAFTGQYREDRLHDPGILYFIKCITAYLDPEIEATGAPFWHTARMKVTTRSGRSYKKLLLHRRGSPDNQLKPEDIEYKFRHVVRPCLPKPDIERVIKLVGPVNEFSSTSELIGILAAPSIDH